MCIPTLGYLINWRSKPSVNFLHAVDLCYELCAAHNSAIVHFVTLIVRSTCEPFSAIFAVIWYRLSDCLMYASACLSQTQQLPLVGLAGSSLQMLKQS